MIGFIDDLLYLGIDLPGRVFAVLFRWEKGRREKEGALKKDDSGRRDLQEKIKSLEKELADLKTDLSLKSQMYNGLKSQYEELEQSLIRPSSKQETSNKPSGTEKDLLSKIENSEEKES